jgi:hypothetical protein
MWTPIYGVLVLDPSRHSPLQLAKAVVPAPFAGQASYCAAREEPQQLPPGAPSGFAVHPAKAYAERIPLHTHARGQKCPRHR